MASQLGRRPIASTWTRRSFGDYLNPRRYLHATLSQVGGQGLFTKEIQRELLAQRVDVAVHSLKDLPTQPIPGLVLAAVPERETTADVLVSSSGASFEELPGGARIGTGSSRRAAQLRHWRGDVQVMEIRGNVDTRLAKLTAGDYEAIVLAAAGLTRLGLKDRITQVLPVERMLPAIGQGALGLECRDDDSNTRAALHDLNHAASMARSLPNALCSYLYWRVAWHPWRLEPQLLAKHCR